MSESSSDYPVILFPHSRMFFLLDIFMGEINQLRGPNWIRPFSIKRIETCSTHKLTDIGHWTEERGEWLVVDIYEIRSKSNRSDDSIMQSRTLGKLKIRKAGQQKSWSFKPIYEIRSKSKQQEWRFNHAEQNPMKFREAQN